VRRIHFIAGLPRSGSTLLAALLRQNPRFHAGVTSPVGTLFTAVQRLMCQDQETATVVGDTHREDVLRGLVENFYARVPPECTVFDTHRIWAAKMPALAALFPDARVICCVRAVPWVFDSLERLALEQPLQFSRIFNYDTAGTIYSRCEAACSGGGLIGFAWNAVREAFYGPFRNRIMLLTYESLASQPVRALQAVYGFVNEAPFQHGFDNVTISDCSYGERLGAPGLHRLHPRVRFAPRETILPPDLFARLARDSFWTVPAARERGVLIV